VSVRREIIVRLVPRTLFLMPTLSIITGTTGWFLAKDLGLLDATGPCIGNAPECEQSAASEHFCTDARFPLTQAAWLAGPPIGVP
jgi:hypothetical protein